MIKLMIKCRFLPLNVDSFYDFKLKSCESTHTHTHTHFTQTRRLINLQLNFTKRACPQLAKANLGGPCLNSRITKIYYKQKLTNKVEGKETVMNNNKKNRYIDLI